MPCKFTSCCCWKIWRRHDDDDDADDSDAKVAQTKLTPVKVNDGATVGGDTDIVDDVKTGDIKDIKVVGAPYEDVNDFEVTNDVEAFEEGDVKSEEGEDNVSGGGSVNGEEDDVGEDAVGEDDEADDNSQGNPRNKCALQPGHSLMDWIRLGSSGKDLTGVGSRAGHLSVTKTELSRHRSEGDAWLAIRGKVFNVTAYLPFHPGGPEELLKGAGIDATKLFDQVHPWVNYDQILQKCYVGRLVTVDPATDTEALFFGNKVSPTKSDTSLDKAKDLEKPPETSGVRSGSTAENQDNNAKESRPAHKQGPSTEQLSKDESPRHGLSIKRSFNDGLSTQRLLKEESCKDEQSKERLLKDGSFKDGPYKPDQTNLTDLLREDKVKFLDQNNVETPVETHDIDQHLHDNNELPRFDWIQKSRWINFIFYTKAFSNPFIEVLPPTQEKVLIIIINYDDVFYTNEIRLEEDVNWPCTITVSYETGKIDMEFKKVESKIWENFGSLHQTKTPSETFNCCSKSNFVVAEKIRVSRSIYIMRLERTDNGKVVTPIGKHVRVFGNVHGQEMSRSYTPIPQTFFSQFSTQGPITDTLCLMIKKYHEGNVSRYLTEREECDVIHVTKPVGDFDLKVLHKRETYLLLAAGTGITPMLAIIQFLLERKIKRCQFARLLFFNKTEGEIPFRDQFEALGEMDNRLQVTHILSEPDRNWGGLSGHINKKMIENAIQEHIKDTGYTISNIFTFVCGPNPFVDLAVDEIKQIGMTDDQIHAFQG